MSTDATNGLLAAKTQRIDILLDELAKEKLRNARLEAMKKLLAQRLADSVGYLRSINTTRLFRDKEGNVYALQTLTWTQGAALFAANGLAALEQDEQAEEGADV